MVIKIFDNQDVINIKKKICKKCNVENMVNNSVIHIIPRYEIEDINLIIHNINGGQSNMGILTYIINKSIYGNFSSDLFLM